MSISVIIATIPGRESFLERAVNSVINQTLKADEIIICCDNKRLGAPINRDKALNKVTNEFVAILDDDDYLLPLHLETLFSTIKEQNADLVYPAWQQEQGFITHLNYIFGKEWDNNNIHQVPITWMAKTQSLIDVGGFSSGFDVNVHELDEQGHRIGEDFNIIKKLVNSNKKIFHVNEITWVWNSNNPGSTQGRPSI
jgi:glycosyltransferase involved in cell wall biosynthesis